MTIHTSNTSPDLDTWHITPDQQRHSILGQNLLLAQQVSKREHLTSLPEAMASQELLAQQPLPLARQGNAAAESSVAKRDSLPCEV